MLPAPLQAVPGITPPLPPPAAVAQKPAVQVKPATVDDPVQAPPTAGVIHLAPSQ